MKAATILQYSCFCQLLTDLGLVKPGSNGTYQLMPIAQRSIDKCISLVQRNMQEAGGQKISLPVLTPAQLWKKSGRLDGDISEFYMVRDRSGKQFLMSPVSEYVNCNHNSRINLVTFIIDS